MVLLSWHCCHGAVGSHNGVARYGGVGILCIGPCWHGVVTNLWVVT